MRVLIASFAANLLLVPVAAPQSTEGLISGRITNTRTGAAIPNAVVTCRNAATNTTVIAHSGVQGIYSLPFLPPGEYALQATADTYQAKVQFGMVLGVGSSLEFDFALRPLADLWAPGLSRAVLAPDQRSLINFYGPDVDPSHWTTYSPDSGRPGKLEASLSDAVPPVEVEQVPLEGHNIYSILLAQPTVAASAATSRSLGISANGMRPSASNFLLDGVDMNFSLISGPLLAVPPEAVQEYRVSTNNYSAEYGGTAGYLANAVTRSGGSVWHGQAYFDLQNGALNANAFQNNVQGVARQPSKETRIGYFAGGPLLRNRLYVASSLDRLRTRDRLAPVSVALPNQGFLSFFGCPATRSLACHLLSGFAAPVVTPADPFVTTVTVSPTQSLNRSLMLQRLDYLSESGRFRSSLRLAGQDLSRPDFIWSPYPDYVSGLTIPAAGVAANITLSSAGGSSVNHAAASWNYAGVGWQRAQPDVPTLVVSGGNNGLIPILPGSLAAYGFGNRNRTLEVNDDQILIRGRHIVKLGAGFLFRRLSDLLNYGAGGEYSFQNIVSFGFDQPSLFTASLSRLAPYFKPPDMRRQYRQQQYSAFIHDVFRATPRLVLNAGLRYENFGGPVSTGGARDPVVQFGPGVSTDQRIAGARLVPSASASLFPGGNWSFGPRVGFGYDLLPRAGLLLRGGFGIFFDRTFDNLWLNARNNSFVFPPGFPVLNGNYLQGIASALPLYSGRQYSTQFPYLTAFQKPFSNAYAENSFLGIERQSGSLLLDIDAAGSLARKLITTDILNRQSAQNPSLPPISWIGTQGLSAYYALTTSIRWRIGSGFLHSAYTWSHAIDSQSDPLAGDFFNLLFVNLAPNEITVPQAGFSAVGDTRGDRGNADFDQRHTFVFDGAWSPRPVSGRIAGKLLNGWSVSALAAVRSGFPYTIYTQVTNAQTLNARARALATATPLLLSPTAVPGGIRIFDPSVFCPSDACSSPETGRNAFAGPGLVNLDASVSRSFRSHVPGESGRFSVRADFFNALNHANLNPPGNIPGTASYGVALFGTPPARVGFPALMPLTETCRRLQVSLRVLF